MKDLRKIASALLVAAMVFTAAAIAVPESIRTVRAEAQADVENVNT